MCKYITHLRVCYICQAEDTVLISEQPCAGAKLFGAFGRCSDGIASEASSNQHQCWQCKERVRRISRDRPLRPIRLH